MVTHQIANPTRVRVSVRLHRFCFKSEVQILSPDSICFYGMTPFLTSRA
jgi:hypothetical protein